jgi:hypothetical protein
MTPEELIDRDKRERERKVEALLLLLFLLARRRAVNAVQVGSDPFAMLAAVLMGNAALGLPGGTARLAALLALADYRGYRRTELLVPGDRFRYSPGVDYRQTAAQALAQMLATLNRKVGEAMRTARAGVSGAVAAIAEAFRTGGYTEANPWRVRGAADNLAGSAYMNGQWLGYERPGLPSLAFRLSSVLDNVTTDICRPRNNVVLPRNHRFWLSNWPKLHHGCRTVVLPELFPFTVTPEDEIPWLPLPAPGFGRAPFALAATWRLAA